MNRQVYRCLWTGLVAGWVIALQGCAKPNVSLPEGAELQGHAATAKKIVTDPLAFLREVETATKELDSFRVEFQRQERLGVIPTLREAEHMVAEYRDSPFSVRFTWTDEDSEFLQCVYVEGQNDNKVALLPRHGILGLPPSVQAYPASWAVLFQKTRNPITDFGPRRMIERTIDRIEKAREVGEVKMRLAGMAEIGPHKELCHHLEIRYPKGDPYACKLQDLYLHTRSMLPVATYLWLPGREERAVELLDAMYQYANIEPNVTLADRQFVIDHPARETSGGKRKGKKSAIASGKAKQKQTAATEFGQAPE